MKKDAPRLPEAATAHEEPVATAKQGSVLGETESIRATEETYLDKADRVRCVLGLNGVTVTLPSYFDDPAFSRRVLGLED